MRLPAQIRGDIFEYLFLMWDPNEPYCSTQRNGVHVGLARLKTKSQDLFYDPWNAPGIFEQSFGMLDYFKRGEYYNILRFTKALVRFEGREDEVEGMPIEDPSKAENRKLGVLKDFMDWFWRSTMLCMHREPFNNPLQWFNCHPEFYDHIQNLSLSYAPRRSYWPEYDNERARPPYTPMNWHVCKIIGEKLHNLNNLLLLVELPFGIIQRCITKRRIYPWMKLVRKLSIRERFEVRLEVSGLEFLKETSAWNLRKQEKYRLEGEIALRDLTLPDCLRRAAHNFEDSDFGTERLFGGSEDG